ncbi:hypothetical protein [Pengzhenrongella sicca]|uniref:Uncharacterized protein n=1 Tax=Pengzhenrongella sicca TaxID=2819238 RepID=A0A8A4ZB24_9MICO|nr:hypothetical protein [Pengzhenrongella sicca]QTE28219.1 hypothetical protein J4E96_12565 [Pengzhenrongella sicca]
MSASRSDRRHAARFVLERRLAPHIDENWAESLLLELRLLGVGGDQIGAALSEVDSHCVESGEGADEAFGDPVAYARSLPLPVADDASPRALLASLGPTAVQLAGMFAMTWSTDSWLAGTPFEVTVGHLVCGLLALASGGILIGFADPILRALITRPRRGGVLLGTWFVAFTATNVAALLLLDASAGSVSAGWLLVLGAVSVTAGTAWALARLRAGSGSGDPITSPVGAEQAAPTRMERLLASRVVAVGAVPFAAVVLFALSVGLHAAGVS